MLDKQIFEYILKLNILFKLREVLRRKKSGFMI